MQEHDDGPSDTAKVATTVTAALASGLIKLPGFTATATTDTNGTATFRSSPQPVTLYRAINALADISVFAREDAYHEAISDALAILTERGFTEQADAINPERFDVTKRPDVRQNALLAAEVLDRWRNDPTSEFTHGDAARAIGSIRQLLAAHDDMEVHRDAARDALSDMRDERDRLTLKLADMTTSRDALDEACRRKDARIAELQAQPVTHATRPEVEILLAGRKDLMREISEVGDTLREVGYFISHGRPRAIYDGARIADLLDRLGAYIVGQDTRLIAAGEALAEAQSELAAAVADRDKADAAHGCAVRDYRAQLQEETDAHRRTVASLDWVQDEFNLGRVSAAYFGTPRGEIAAILVRDLRAEIEQHKSDVAMAERAYDTELRKRQEAETRCAALEMRIEGAIFALRHGMNEHRDGMDIRFSPSTTLIDYLAAPMGDKPRCRVVTSPRFYDEEATRSAVMALWVRFATSLSHGERPTREYYEEAVAAVAAALGMRRAAS